MLNNVSVCSCSLSSTEDLLLIPTTCLWDTRWCQGPLLLLNLAGMSWKVGNLPDLETEETH